MSKQLEAKEAQGYVQSGPCCGNCVNFGSEFKPIAWMLKHNERIDAGNGAPWASKYDLNLRANQQEYKLRCNVGGFTIKKAGHCNLYERREAA